MYQNFSFAFGKMMVEHLNESDIGKRVLLEQRLISSIPRIEAKFRNKKERSPHN
jgi:hypothetical protein